jgi:hypothetical protein
VGTQKNMVMKFPGFRVHAQAAGSIQSSRIDDVRVHVGIALALLLVPHFERKMPFPVNKIFTNEQVFVKYSCWWDDLNVAKQQFPDIVKIVVRGTIVNVDFEKRKATICYPALMETRKESFTFFSNLSVQSQLKKGFRELNLEEFLQRTCVLHAIFKVCSHVVVFLSIPTLFVFLL